MDPDPLLWLDPLLVSPKGRGRGLEGVGGIGGKKGGAV